MRFYICIHVYLYCSLLSLSAGVSTGSDGESSYIIIQGPRPARVYQGAPPGLPVTRVIARPGVFTGITDVQPERDGTSGSLPKCLPHFYILENKFETHRHFLVDRCHGIISTSRQIDEPLGYVYKATVIATDSGNVTLGWLNVTIEVTEFNAETPHFTSSHYSHEVLNSAKVGSLLMTVTATDSDVEPYNRELYYFLQDSSNEEILVDPWLNPTKDPLTINLRSGEIRLSSAWTEGGSSLHLRLGVTDGGSPFRSSFQELIIHVRNISVPQNVNSLNITETSGMVCWSPPLRGIPEGYLIYQFPTSSDDGPHPRNVTAQHLEAGLGGLVYEPESDAEMGTSSEEVVISASKLRQYCVGLEDLLPFTNYSFTVRGWGVNGTISMATSPITVFTMKIKCSSTPCKNGVCRDANESPGFFCSCSPGFQGSRCEFMDNCNGYSACLNGGSCIRKETGEESECRCVKGYFGDSCEKMDVCYLNEPCQHGGKCVSSSEEDFICICSGDFSGRTCEEKASNNPLTGSCPAENTTYLHGKVLWPTTAKGNTAVMGCPSNVADSVIYDEDFTQDNERLRNDSEDIEALMVDADMAKDPLPTYTAIAEITIPISRTERSVDSSVLTPPTSIPIWPRVSRACVEDEKGNAVWLTPDFRFCRISKKDGISSTAHPSVSSLNNLDEALSDINAANNLMTLISNMLEEGDSPREGVEAAKDALDIIEEYTAKVVLFPGESIKIRTANLVVEARLVRSKLISDHVAFRPFADSGPTFASVRDMWIQIPRDSLSGIADGNFRFQFAAFRNDKLFRSEKGGQEGLHLPVIAASVAGSEMDNLTKPVTYKMELKKYYGDERKPKCVYWDHSSNAWKDDGILTQGASSEVVCHSSHLTAFSVLLDPIGTPADNEHADKLSLITSVGIAISTLALLATLTTFALFRSLNRDRSGIIVMNLAASLLLLNASFVVATRISTDSSLCVFAAASLHYAVGASFTWMLIEGQNMYHLLVTVFPSSETHFKLKRLFLGWGFPLTLVSLALIWNKDVYANNALEYCVITPLTAPQVYYTTYLGPISLVLLFNLVVFVRVTSVLCQRRPTAVKSTHKRLPFTLAQFRGSVTVVALLGITWVAGVLAVGQLRLLLQYLFCLTTPSQGLIIFIVRVLQGTEARAAWKSFLKTGSLRRRSRTQSSSTSKINSSHTTVSSGRVLSFKKFSFGASKDSLDGKSRARSRILGSRTPGGNYCEHTENEKSSSIVYERTLLPSEIVGEPKMPPPSSLTNVSDSVAANGQLKPFYSEPFLVAKSNSAKTWEGGSPLTRQSSLSLNTREKGKRFWCSTRGRHSSCTNLDPVPVFFNKTDLA